jgi:preprotein translocase subunit YajC
MIHHVPFFLLLAQQPGGGVSSIAPFVFQVVAIIGIFYFIMIRPQQKQKKEHEERLRNLKRGDRVVTTGGIIGEVVHLKDSGKEVGQRSMDDEITIKSADSRLLVERGRIARVLSAESASSSTTQTK